MDIDLTSFFDKVSIFLSSKRAANRVMRDISRFVRDRLHLEVNQAKSAVWMCYKKPEGKLSHKNCNLP